MTTGSSRTGSRTISALIHTFVTCMPETINLACYCMWEVGRTTIKTHKYLKVGKKKVKLFFGALKRQRNFRWGPYMADEHYDAILVASQQQFMDII